MALPKTFTPQERLFAEDLNDALEYLDGETAGVDSRLTVVENNAITKPSSPTNGQVLTYNTGSSSWVAQTPAAPGKLLQMVHAVDTTNRTTQSGTFVDAGISASITPVSSLSTLLITWTFTMGATSGQGDEGTENAWFRLVVGSSTSITGTDGAAHFEEQNGQYSSSGSMGIVRGVVSPSGSGARTYKGQFRFGGGLNASINNASYNGVLTIMEISA